MNAHELAALLLYGQKRYFLSGKLDGSRERSICEHGAPGTGEIHVLSTHSSLDEALLVMKQMEITHAANLIKEMKCQQI